MKDEEPIEITVKMIAESPKALFVSETGSPADAFWVPKSCVEFEPSYITNRFFILKLPYWLAHQKGLT